MGIECGAVVGILGGEGGHPDRLRVPHVSEQGIDVRVVNRPQRHLSHKRLLTWSSIGLAAQNIQRYWIVGEESASASAASRVLWVVTLLRLLIFGRAEPWAMVRGCR